MRHYPTLGKKRGDFFFCLRASDALTNAGSNVVTSWAATGRLNKSLPLSVSGFTPTIVQTFNGSRKAVYFPGTGQYTANNVNQQIFQTTDSPLSFAAVFSATSVTGSQFYFGANSNIVMGLYGGSPYAVVNGWGGSSTSTALVQVNTPVALVFNYLGKNVLDIYRSVGGIVTKYMTSIGPINNKSFYNAVGTTTVTSYQIGALGGFRFQGYLAEMRLWNGALTSSRINEVFDEFRLAYGVG